MDFSRSTARCFTFRSSHLGRARVMFWISLPALFLSCPDVFTSLSVARIYVKRPIDSIVDTVGEPGAGGPVEVDTVQGAVGNVASACSGSGSATGPRLARMRARPRA